LLEGGFCFLHYLPQGRWAFSTLKDSVQKSV